VFSAGTVGCNMKCRHCQNGSISRADPSMATTFLSPLNFLDLARRNHCNGVAWTYNEPTIWFEFTLDCAIAAKEHGFYTVYVTNGYINEAPLDAIGPYLDAYRVDIKGFSSSFAHDVCGVPDFEPVLNAAKRAKHKWNMHVEVVTNIIPGHNDDDEQLNGIAHWIVDNLGADTVWSVTRFFPHLEMSHVPPTPMETLLKAKAIGEHAGLKYVILGNVQ